MEESDCDDRGQDSGDPFLEPETVAGHRIGHLVALKVLEDANGTPQRVLFKCDCGKLVRISLIKIRRGKFKDGCQKCWKPPPGKPGRPRKEVCQRTLPYEYKTWLAIKKKARGLWATSFEKFIKDMGPRPFKDAFLLRRDPKEKYYPTNCYWGKRGEQMMTRPLTYKGEPMTPAEASKKFGMRKSFVNKCRVQNIRTVEEMLDLWKTEQARFEIPYVEPQPIIGPEGFELA